MSVAPPIDSTAPKRTRPEIVSLSIFPSAWTPTTAPTAKPSLPAVDSSTTISPAPGQAPSTRVSVLNRSFVGSTLKPRLGAPPYTTALPSSPISWVDSLPTPPIASSTSGSASTSSSSDSSNVGASAPLPPLRSNAVWPVIVASVSR